MTNLPSGKVYLVGAGPGDPGLITRRGVDCLARADLVLYDYLVNPEILVHAPATAECICLGQHGHSRIWSQAEINDRMVMAARNGHTVVRLKGGDPAIFARGAEELECLVEQGISFEVVPGITAALAASSYAGIPITHRELASAVALITGQENSAKEAAAVDYEALAKFPGTLVFYMGVTSVQTWAGALLRGGKPPETPAAIIRRCSLPDQRTVHCSLGEVAEQLTPATRMRPPVIVIIGPVTQLAAKYAWFEKRPLFGRTVLVTRPVHQSQALTSPLAELGARVLRQPAIEIGPPASWHEVDMRLARLDQYDWLVFSSSNGVQYFLDRLWGGGRDTRQLAHLQIAAIGPGTAAALQDFRLRADIVPGEFRAEELAAALAPRARGRRCLLVRASRGREVLAESLASAGAHIDQVVAYESRDVRVPDPEIARRMADGAIDWTTVTSSAIATSLARMFGEHLRRTRLASISPVTSTTLRELGFEPSIEARDYTMAGLIDALALA